MNRSLPKEILAHLVTCCPRLMVSALFVPYGQSLGRTLRQAESIAAECPHDFSRHSHAAVSVALNRMKNKKLVAVSGPKKKAIWRITQKGRTHFRRIDDLAVGNVLPSEDGKTRLFVFDVPEDMREGRNWLRRELISCEYTPLQRSVFFGLRPLPDKFLKELEQRGLRSYIHIVGLENE